MNLLSSIGIGRDEDLVFSFVFPIIERMGNNWSLYTLCEPGLKPVSARYVGITSKAIKKRFNEHMTDKRHNTYKVNWINHLQKKGLQPEQFLVMDGLTESKVKELEVHFIKYYNFRLTNLTAGGDGCTGYKPTAKTRKMLSDRMKGNKHGKGKLQTNELKKLRSSLMKGNKNGCGNKGNKLTEEQKRKLAKAKSIRIKQLSLEGQFVAFFQSAKDASIKLGISKSAIGKVCKKVPSYLTAGGYKWEYA